MALTDGMVAIIITIMVLEMHPPHAADLAGLAKLWPVFFSYAVSFVYVAIYWNNHHHFFRLIPHVGASIMWSNLNLLFWLSLVPFSTAWIGEHPFSPVPTAIYGAVLLACALSFTLMQGAAIRSQGTDSPVRHAIGRDLKGKLSPLLYLAGVAIAFVQPILSYLFYAAVAVMWLIPDRRVESELGGGH